MALSGLDGDGDDAPAESRLTTHIVNSITHGDDLRRRLCKKTLPQVLINEWQQLVTESRPKLFVGLRDEVRVTWH